MIYSSLSQQCIFGFESHIDDDEETKLKVLDWSPLLYVRIHISFILAGLESKKKDLLKK